MSTLEPRQKPYTQSLRLPTATSQAAIDRFAIEVGVLYGVAMLVLLAIQYMIVGHYGAAPAFCLLLFFCHLTLIRRSISDPFTIMLLFGFIYFAFPILFGQPYSWDSLNFGFDDAAVIYAVGSVSMIFGIALSIALIKHQHGLHKLALGNTEQRLICRKAGLFSSVISLLLTVMYLGGKGAVALGHVSYADSFRNLEERGAGIFLLAVPLAAGGVALMITSTTKLGIRHHCAGVLAYCALYLALGQRKYLIIPGVFYAAQFLRINSVTKLIALISASLLGLSLFVYLGFLRNEGVSLSRAFDPDVVDAFIAGGPSAFGNESVPVFATAAAAHDEYVAPLPYAGDYLRAWMMSLPQIIFGERFVAANDRFARTYDPRRAFDGMGFGFSFFGEAYLVGGFPMIVIATACIVLFFRWIYVAGGGTNRSGIVGAISLSSLPFAFWFQRNAAAYFLKEFLVLQVGTIIAAFVCTKILVKQFHKHARARRYAFEPYNGKAGIHTGPAVNGESVH